MPTARVADWLPVELLRVADVAVELLIVEPLREVPTARVAVWLLEPWREVPIADDAARAELPPWFPATLSGRS